VSTCSRLRLVAVLVPLLAVAAAADCAVAGDCMRYSDCAAGATCAYGHCVGGPPSEPGDGASADAGDSNTSNTRNDDSGASAVPEAAGIFAADPDAPAQ
jgi:hypothetical protein